MDDNDSLGIRSIYEACYALYPDQATPPQVTAIHKFWLGGPDPLDYISMYENKGDAATGSPPHWHYISYGISDLYGDARIHGQSANSGPSGFGFELTMRIKRGQQESKAPLWPAMLLQSLARYLFRSQAKFVAGDHIPWGRSLEDIGHTGSCDSRICNMLIATDPELPRANSPFGWIDFLLVVGICDDEMQLARAWSGLEVATAMERRPETGGRLLVTDMRRVETLTGLEPGLDAHEGSTMSGVTTEVSWDHWRREDEDGGVEDIIDVVGDHSETRGGDGETLAALANVTDDRPPPTPFYGVSMSPGTLELFPPCYLDAVHLKISASALEVLPSVLAHRLRRGRHFTLLHCRSDTAVTLVTENVTGAFVSEERPFGHRGSWLQVLLGTEGLLEVEARLAGLDRPLDRPLPLRLACPRAGILISVLPPGDEDLDAPPPL